MKSARVLLKFMKYNWIKFYFEAVYISSTLYKHDTFNNAPVTQAILDAAIFNLKVKGIAAMPLGIVKTTNRKVAHDELKILIKKLTFFVNSISEGRKEIIELSGFDVCEFFSHHSGDKKFSAKNGKPSGKVILKWKKVPKAKSYKVRYWLVSDGDNPNYIYPVSKSTTGLVLNGLTKGQEYMFSMVAVFANNQGEWYNPISLMMI